MSQLSECDTLNSDEDCFLERKKFPLPPSAPPPSQASENDHSPLNTPTSVPQFKKAPSLPNPPLPSPHAPIFFPMGFPNPMMDPRALGFPLSMMMSPMAMQLPFQQPPPQPQPQLQPQPMKEYQPKVETRTTEQILQKIFEKPLTIEESAGDVGDDKKYKKKPPSIIRTAEFDWDSQHRREKSAFERGTVVVRCEDVDSVMFEEVIWFVNGHQLIQKYICEKKDPVFGKIFIKTDRYIGWLADEPWSYYTVNDCILLDEARERIGVKEFPTREVVRQHCLSGRENNEFYETLVQKFGAPSWPATENGEETTTNNEFYKNLVQKFITSSRQGPTAGEEMEGHSQHFEVKVEMEDDNEPVEMKYIPPSQQ